MESTCSSGLYEMYDHAVLQLPFNSQAENLPTASPSLPKSLQIDGNFTLIQGLPMPQ